MSYIGHRRFLPRYHPYQFQKKAFNNEEEIEIALEPLKGEEILAQVQRLNFWLGKKKANSRATDINEKFAGRKNLFFSIDYWKSLYVRHTLDVMHIEKNVCESLVGTLLDIPGKSKDGFATRMDLDEMGVRKELLPRVGQNGTKLPPACYTLSREEKKNFCKTLFENKVPDVHLVREVKLCGPVYLRWIDQFERQMKILKDYVQNRDKPEGCIAESYIAKEAIEFCIEYLYEVDEIGITPKKYRFDVGLLLPSGCVVRIDHKLWVQVEIQLNESRNNILEALRWIAHGPRPEVIKYQGYEINGYRFHTKERDDLRVVQNSGVYLDANTFQISIAKDKNHVVANMSFYGVIQEIWELDYNQFKIPVFKCDWAENNRVIKKDEQGLTLVNLNRIGHKDDGFILASQPTQVFYVEDQLDPRWSIVIVTPRGEYIYDSREDLGDIMLEHRNSSNLMPSVELFDKNE
ncbi:uncharacterized protein LOC127899867 [Citrus sinensis]|uniref:uncharacterized protein LOC127899867 n=1 Tax=Citrus sinensis TaxID=2711 RepID=UPI00227915AD|nr:uncharacterized protein LOC127899867 [Citrus sinensis]